MITKKNQKEGRGRRKRGGKKARKFDFETYGISVGEEIYFSRDEDEKAIVLEGNKIRWNDEETSLSIAAKKLLGDPSYGVSGTLYWMYDGETLDERRKRMDEDLAV